MSAEHTALADVHNHLVPGVDDGARTVDDVLDSVDRLLELGVRRIITTPHIDGSLSHAPAALEERLGEVTAAFERAAEAVGQRFADVEFRRGHEVMLDVPDVVFDDPRLRMAGTSFVLVEWPRLHLPPGTFPVLERICGMGWKPIVAHPERYNGHDEHLQLAESWRAAGAYLQVNYGSLVGRYGSDAQTLAFRLLRRGMVDYLASDFHGIPERKIYRKEAARRLEELGAEEALGLLTRTNPGRVFRDEAPLPVPPLPAERGFWAKLREILRMESA